MVNKGIPDALPIGRALAVARAGVLGALPSLGIQMVLGTVCRRRGVVGMRSQDHEPYTPAIYIWFQPSAFRKTADKILSGAAHQVPLVGWAAGVVDLLERRLRRDDSAGWLFPVARPRHAGAEPKTPHMNVGTLNYNMDAMPGVYGSCRHSASGWRSAATARGSAGWPTARLNSSSIIPRASSMT